MKTFNIIKSIFIMVFCFSLVTSIFAQADWLMINGNPQRTNFVPEEKTLLPPLEKETDITQWCEYLLKKDDIFYLASGETPNSVTAYDISNENILWKFELEGSGGSISFYPAISKNLIFIGGQLGKGLYALDRNTGEQKWFKPFGSLFSKSPIIDNKGHIFICDYSGVLYCLNENTGETVWSLDIQGGYLTPAFYKDKIYLSTYNDIIAYNSKTGEKLWKRIHSSGSRGHILTDDTGAFLCVNNTIACYNLESGSEKWYYQLPDSIYCPSYTEGVACLTDSILCVSLVNQAQTNGRLLAINKFTGVKQWEYISDYSYLQSPKGANGFIYANKNFSNWIAGFDQMTGNIVFQDTSQNYWGIIIAGHKLYTLSQAGITIFKTKTSNTFNQTIKETSFDIYPNPCKNILNINFNNSEIIPEKIEIYNITGNKVIMLDSITNRKNININVSQLIPGTYFVKIKGKSGITFVKKIIII